MSVVAGASAAAVLAGMAHSDTVLRTGPSSSATPYVIGVPGSPVREMVSILTVGDTVGGYQFVGIPDGMGGFLVDGQLKVYIDHEFTASANVGRRAHQPQGFSGGAFLSGWTVNPTTFEVLNGFDAMTSTATTTNGTGGSLYNFARFCSGDIAEPSAYFNAATGLGTANRFFVCGEESGTPGRMIATDLSTGVGYEMPALSTATTAGSWEQGAARPMASDQTVMVGLSDGGANRVFLYVGTKQATGNPAAQAGLLNGDSYGIQVQVNGSNVSNESRDFGFASAAPAVFSGTFIVAPANTAAGTQFLRPEDGAWDPANPSDFYFVTTDRMSTTTTGAPQTHASRLYRLRFSDVNNVLAGGTIEAVLDGTDVMEMGDNLCVFNTIQGGTRVMIQEDPGNHPHPAKHLVYDAQADTLEVVLTSDPARFGNTVVAATAPFNRDEEVSGVFDARDSLGLGWFIGNIQCHYTLAAPLIEGGQMYAFFAPEVVGSCDADCGSVPNGVVDGADLTALLSAWGTGGRTDINQDGTTNGIDLTFLLASWGNCSN